MEILIRNTTSDYKEVVIKVDQTTLDLGLLNEKERKELAETFLTAVQELLF